jgi:hypothetical protein
MQSLWIYSLLMALVVGGTSAWCVLRFVGWRSSRRLIVIMSSGVLIWIATGFITMEARYRLGYFGVILILYLPILLAGLWNVIRRRNDDAA